MAKTTAEQRPKKRAIALAGGGPTVGFHIGALEALEEYDVKFDVWSLSCIGAWVGIYYNQLTGSGRAARTYEFFREHAFRDTASYEGFPVNKAFAPNLGAYATAWMTHCMDPRSYWNAFNAVADLPGAAAGWARFMTTPKMWSREGDVNAHVLNNIMAVHPASRFLTSLIYMSGVNGCSNIYYKDSSFLDDIKLGKLDLIPDEDLDHKSGSQLCDLAAHYDPGDTPTDRKAIPEIYHNAWRLTDDSRKVGGNLQLFNNKWVEYRNGKRKPRTYLPITHPSLCACSALPYVEQTVRIPNDDGNEYSEGALVDTVSFRNLVEDHPDLDEIWVCRIVDYRQVRLQKNLHDSLGNLCEQFAAEVGENDVELFKNHLRKSPGRIPRVVEIPLELETQIDYRWDHENLDIGRAEGKKAVKKLMDADKADKLRSPMTSAPAWPPSP